MAIPVGVEFQDQINQRVQTPVGKLLIQTATPDGSKAATQTLIGNILSYSITRSEDPTSDVAQVTIADDLGNYASTNRTGRFSKLFQPGVIDTKFVLYTGLEGCVFPDRPYFIQRDRNLLQKFTGFLESDAFVQKQFMLDKTISLIDLTKQFRFPVNDAYPHPLYGDQTLPYFDPTYNLKPLNIDGNGNAVSWQCDGRMFTANATVPVYGSTHLDVAVFVDTTGGNAPASVATTLANTFDLRNGVCTFGAPIPAKSVVSLQGNPTYMAPETMVRKILLELAYWSPNFLALDHSGVLLPQFLGNGKSVWQCLKEIAAYTSPRFIPWQMWADENGYLRFYESRVDGPPVRVFTEGHDIITSSYENTARQLRTVVRADGTVLTSNGSDQPVVSISYDLHNIDKYGQTEPLQITAEATQSVRHLSTTQAISYLNMLTASTLAQVSRPSLAVSAEIWPDTTIQPGDKIAIRDTRIGMDKQFMVKDTVEQVSGKVHRHELKLEEFYDTINYMVGIPAGVQGATSAAAQGAATPPPTLSIIGAVHAGTGIGSYPLQDGQFVTDPNNDSVLPVWNANDSSAMNFDVYLNSLPQSAVTYPNNGSNYSYSNRPPAYNWIATPNLATGQTVYYGTVPANDTSSSHLAAGTRVYVGPDNVFYYFNHAPPIVATDKSNVWLPPGNTAPDGIGVTPTYPSQTVTVYLWQWWYLLLDSTLGAGKFYRPIQRVNAAQDGVGVSISTAGGKWVYNPYSGPPGSNPQSYYYGNVVAGIDDYYQPPAGFVGANVMAETPPVNVGVAFGPNIVGGTYTGYRKFNKGHYCLFACNSVGQRQFMRVPFLLAL